MKTRNKQIAPPKAYHAYKILGWLLDKPMSGYDIKRKLQRISHILGSCSNAQIYPVLKQLELSNLVTSMLDKDSGKRQRKTYKITAAGKKYILNWLKQPTSPVCQRDELTLKMSMGFNLSKTQWKDILQHYQLQLDATKLELTQIRAHIERDHKGRADQKYLKLAYNHLQKIQQARLEWIDTCREELNIK